jgi:hypothetical protein
MTSRAAETRLANFTLIYLAFYVPIETFASWPYLTSPYYLVDAVAMVLLLWGALHSRGARPHAAPGLLAAGWAWAAANYWRAFFDRVKFLREEGGELMFGEAEYWTVGVALVIAIVCLSLAAVTTVATDQA